MALIARNLLGIAVLLFIAFIFSTNRRGIRLRTILPALLAQVGIGAFILFVPFGKSVLSAAAAGVNHVLGYANAGIEFLFGGLVQSKMFELFGNGGFVFAVRVLPAIIFVTALISVLYYLGIMRWIVIVLGTIFQKLLGVSKIESFSAVTTIFLGQSEMPAVVKPFARDMTSAELFAVMSSGMAAVAGSVLAGYAGLGVKVEYLLAASFMAVPGGLLFAKIIHPTSEASRVTLDNLNFDEKRPANVIEAASSGATVGLKIAVMVGAMLIAFVGLIAMLNGIVGGIGGWFGDPNVSMQSVLGAVFAPLAYLIGVPWDQAALAGSFLGQKLILNEFVAYASLSPYLKDSASVAAAGLQVLDPRTIAILSFALCGFANFSSIAVLTGGFSAVAPERRAEVARYGLRVVLAATLSNLMSATIAGMFLTLN
ncbi:Putative nucleoside permease NupX (plasmid) [Caballeronia sp. SBC1]|uniref:NupC/NupG family nucleoside CNT transporter n=1 Tax=unclassified Caballeronia TaxID=2646786 RepID=UPI0013E1BEF6|nr:MULTISPECIES: NupC/NupG family nucleoside CNT transporter [unclassified Caballeronia]QIE27747.1 Putative nucleoside permease NupX [Caballeronia sp. SBC2]QIN65812.1 Putative nucleoside permease NupX [Caballeronia sp. SBC1]